MNDTSINTNDLNVVIWHNGESIQESSLISPQRWRGQSDCLVGPFSSREVAEYFVHPVVDFGHYDVCAKNIFAKRDSWYVEIESLSVVLQRGQA